MTSRAAAKQDPLTQPSPLQSASEPVASLSLPSDHLNHSVVYENEIQGRLHGFKSGIAAVEGELEGMEQELNRKIGELQAAHEADKAKKLRLLNDLQKAHHAAQAGLEAIQGYEAPAEGG